MPFSYSVSVQAIQTEVTAIEALLNPEIADILLDTDTTIPALIAAISALLTPEIADILADTGTTLPAAIAALSALLTPEIADILIDTGTTLPATLALLATAATLAVVQGLLDPEIAEILADVTGLAGAAMRGTDGVDIAAMRGTDLALLAANYLGHQFTGYDTDEVVANLAFFIPAAGTVLMSVCGDLTGAGQIEMYDAAFMFETNLAAEDGFSGTWYCDGTDIKVKNTFGAQITIKLKGLTMS